MELKWSSQALDDRENVFKIIAEHNPRVAIIADDVIEQSSERLLEDPELGANRDDCPCRQLILPDVNMIICYVVQEDFIIVLRVLHQNQQYPW